MARSRVIDQHIRDIAALAKAKSDAQAIIHLCEMHRHANGVVGDINKYISQIEEKARGIVSEVDNTNQ